MSPYPSPPVHLVGGILALSYLDWKMSVSRLRLSYNIINNTEKYFHQIFLYS